MQVAKPFTRNGDDDHDDDKGADDDDDDDIKRLNRVKTTYC